MLVMRPHKIWSLFKSVAFTTAACEATYVPAWACDGIPGRPVRCTAATGALSITGTAGMVDTVVLANHNIWAPATVVLSGDISAAFTIPARRPNDIPLNPFIHLGSPVSVDALTVTVTSNHSEFIVGEVLAGLAEPWDLLASDNEFSYTIFPLAAPDDSEQASVRPYASGREARGLSGSNYATLAQKQFVEDWLAGTWENTRPSVLIPNEDENDAWVVKLGASITWQQLRGAPNRDHLIRMSFSEYHRRRW